MTFSACSLLISIPGAPRRCDRSAAGPSRLCSCWRVVCHLQTCHFPGFPQAEVSSLLPDLSTNLLQVCGMPQFTVHEDTETLLCLALRTAVAMRDD